MRQLPDEHRADHREHARIVPQMLQRPERMRACPVERTTPIRRQRFGDDEESVKHVEQRESCRGEERRAGAEPA